MSVYEGMFHVFQMSGDLIPESKAAWREVGIFINRFGKLNSDNGFNYFGKGNKSLNIITVDNENIEKEHICCAIADKKGECQVSSKKAWMKARFNDGLVFKKGDVRGKVFIEYIPAEKAWCPIIAEKYMFINCLWVSGKYKGQGISNKLLDECIEDSKNKGKKGLVILSSNKKRPYLADKKYLIHKGFLIADRAEPYYELLYLPFKEAEINLPLGHVQRKVK